MLRLSVCIIGESKTGKTSFFNYLLDQEYSHLLNTTFGVNCDTVSFIKDNIYWKIYDTSGHKDYINITRQYLKFPDFFLLFFDINNRLSFEKLEYWISLLEKKENIILIGNKCELFKEVSQTEIFDITSKYNLKYIEISIKNNYNVNEVSRLVNSIANNKKRIQSISNDYIKLNNDEEERAIRKCCECIIL